MNGLVETALCCLGRGFDLACDFRAKYCKGEERLVVINEKERQELVVPGVGVFPGVSGDVKCDKGERIRFQPDVLEFDKMSELFNQRCSLSGRIPSGHFNAMFGFGSSTWMQDAAETKSLAMDGFFVSLFNLRIDRRPLGLSDYLISSVPSTWDPVALARFIENFGTHIIVGLSVGGQDVVYVRQEQSSNLSTSEIKQHLDKLGDQLFTGTCTLPLFHGKSKELKNKAPGAFIGADRIQARSPAMAMASRLLSRSKQLYAGGAILQRDHAVHVRSFAKEAAPLKGDEMLKNIFYDVKNKFETALGILRKEKITIDPEDPAAVTQYAKVMKTIREKADLFSESQRIKNTIQQRTQDIPDARTYLLTLQEIRAKSGLIDELGAEPMMLEALEKVEKDIKKPLLRSDKKNMGLLLAEFDKINKKLGIRKEDLPKYEEDLELKIAKEQLKELKTDALEAMETQMKREEFKDEQAVDVKALDIRNFI